jgi:alanine-synthesizing transaminase
MRTSRRIPEDLDPSPLSQRLAGIDAVDLTESNPSRCGFDLAGVEATLARAATVQYEPRALGSDAARAAVADYVRSWIPEATPDRVVLCASTSEAYAWLFKLLCDAGDTVAAPAPSYPLFDVLADLEGVELSRYRLTYDGRWRVDMASVEQVLQSGARALVVVQPNNPTGSALAAEEIDELRSLCAAHDALVISDEVFGAYGAGGGRVPTLAGGGSPTVVLDGLSKAAALPGLKLSWMVLCGERIANLGRRLEWIADAYLSVATPIQRALPTLLPLAPPIQQQISGRVRRNRKRLTAALSGVSSIDVLAADGGWYGVVRVPRVLSDDDLVVALAERAQVLTQPGYFYDFDSEGYLVVSLLPTHETFAPAIGRMASVLAELCS